MKGLDFRGGSEEKMRGMSARTRNYYPPFLNPPSTNPTALLFESAKQRRYSEKALCSTQDSLRN